MELEDVEAVTGVDGVEVTGVDGVEVEGGMVTGTGTGALVTGTGTGMLTTTLGVEVAVGVEVVAVAVVVGGAACLNPHSVVVHATIFISDNGKKRHTVKKRIIRTVRE